MSLIKFCPNTSFLLPFPFFPLGSFVALSYSVDRRFLTISLLQLSLTIVLCITETKLSLFRCIVLCLFPVWKNQVHVLQLQSKTLPLGPVFLWERELVITLPWPLQGPVIESLSMMGNS